MDQKIFIISGNYAEYTNWIKKNMDRNKIKPISLSNYVYVGNIYRLRGHREVHGYFIGTFRSRPDIRDIVNQIRCINDIPDRNRVI
jgi:hypothetical protein